MSFSFPMRSRFTANLGSNLVNFAAGILIGLFFTYVYATIDAISDTPALDASVQRGVLGHGRRRDELRRVRDGVRGG